MKCASNIFLVQSAESYSLSLRSVESNHLHDDCKRARAPSRRHELELTSLLAEIFHELEEDLKSQRPRNTDSGVRLLGVEHGDSGMRLVHLPRAAKNASNG